MTKPIARDSIYRRQVFDAEFIELCVRWYITYRLSYRDLAGMMAERGVMVAHSTILRWVTRYVPERRAGTDSLDLSVHPGAATRRTFPFGANGTTSIERSTSKGKALDFLLRRDRGIAAAQAFFRPRDQTALCLHGRL
jgi:transposase-like protein